MIRLLMETNTTADFKFQFTGPASPTKVYYAGFGCTDTIYTVCGATATAFSTSIPAGGYQANNYLFIYGYLKNGANAGNVTFQWAENVASGTMTVFRGSTMTWKKLN